jgi:hypothetical protein
MVRSASGLLGHWHVHAPPVAARCCCCIRPISVIASFVGYILACSAVTSSLFSKYAKPGQDKLLSGQVKITKVGRNSVAVGRSEVVLRVRSRGILFEMVRRRGPSLRVLDAKMKIHMQNRRWTLSRRAAPAPHQARQKCKGNRDLPECA